MPKALTPEEKMQKVIEKKNEERGIIADAPLQDKPVIRKAPDRGSRTQRGMFNGTRGKLKISEEDIRNFTEAGWKLHIMNDQDGRIEQALSAGYEFVTRDEIGGVVANVVDGNVDLGDRVKFRVGKTESGDGLFAYLMKVPLYIYEEEQLLLQSRNDRTDAAIRAGTMTKAGMSADGFYGQEGIKLQTK